MHESSHRLKNLFPEQTIGLIVLSLLKFCITHFKTALVRNCRDAFRLQISRCVYSTCETYKAFYVAELH